LYKKDDDDDDGDGSFDDNVDDDNDFGGGFGRLLVSVLLLAPHPIITHTVFIKTH